MNLADELLSAGREALESIHGRTVTIGDSDYVAVINEAEADKAQRRGPPDFNTRFGSIIDVKIADLPTPPDVQVVITDDAGRKHRIMTVARVGLVWRMTCKPNS